MTTGRDNMALPSSISGKTLISHQTHHATMLTKFAFHALKNPMLITTDTQMLSKVFTWATSCTISDTTLHPRLTFLLLTQTDISMELSTRSNLTINTVNQFLSPTLPVI